MSDRGRDAVFERHMRTVAGVAGTLVAPFVLTFAIVGGSTGVAFAPDVAEGGSVLPWMDAVRASPVAARLVVISLSLGFASMFLAGFGLFQLLDRTRWQKYVAQAGHLIGIPVAIGAFAEYYTMISRILVVPEGSPAASMLEAQAGLAQHQWALVSTIFGPSLVVVLGTGLFAWCAWQERLIPAWLGLWGILCSLSAFIYLFWEVFPVPPIFGLGAGPANMVWYTLVGLTLLRRRSG